MHAASMSFPDFLVQDSRRSGLDGTSGAKPKKDRETLARVAREFETIFINTMMKSMRKTVKKSELFSGGRGEEIFQDLLDTTFAETAARHGRGFGIARVLVDRYTRNAGLPAGKNTEGQRP